VVCDTTVLLYLARIEQIELLPSLFASIYVPEPVITELDMGRLLRRDTVDPRELDWATRVSVTPSELDALPSNRLGAGERAVLAYARAYECDIVGLDDFQARALATQMGLQVVGTLGVLLLAKRHHLISELRPLIDALVNEGFRLDGDLRQVVLRLANESD
jgi:hypothetical protein